MGKRKVKEYSAEFKTKVVLEVLKENQSQAEIASRYKIPSSTIPSWIKHFLGNAENVFKGSITQEDFIHLLITKLQTKNILQTYRNNLKISTTSIRIKSCLDKQAHYTPTVSCSEIL